ncbi:hypothetical protein CPB83DRAFT_141409 [Crepidotus variabilis]|uniref:Uncharacterized protein n=1 Tax=Crepidotus variabilis TaxID=179855 RepID=A0A9P6E3Y3_9AGAR|nr:hypothetical protein CPB83DRAFT_141409 [Crepidotus variabilis]
MWHAACMEFLYTNTSIPQSHHRQPRHLTAVGAFRIPTHQLALDLSNTQHSVINCPSNFKSSVRVNFGSEAPTRVMQYDDYRPRSLLPVSTNTSGAKRSMPMPKIPYARRVVLIRSSVVGGGLIVASAAYGPSNLRGLQVR